MGFRTTISALCCGVTEELQYGEDYTIDGNNLQVTLLKWPSLFNDVSKDCTCAFTIIDSRDTKSLSKPYTTSDLNVTFGYCTSDILL